VFGFTAKWLTFYLITVVELVPNQKMAGPALYVEQCRMFCEITAAQLEAQTWWQWLPKPNSIFEQSVSLLGHSFPLRAAYGIHSDCDPCDHHVTFFK
jgi:hypothetical protein